MQLRSSLLALLSLSAPAAGDTLFVDANLTTGADDGSSWADAFQGALGLQDALAAAQSGDQVFVAEGTYKPASSGDRQTSFSLVDGVEIYGGFLGVEASPAERPPFGDAPSVMSADLDDDDGSGTINDNSYHLIRGNGVSASAVVDGFTMTGGNANGSGNNSRGGAVLTVGGASPTFRNCRIVGNRCTFGGGAGYIAGNAAPSFTDVVFEGNDGGSFGGAFDLAGAGAVRFEGCVFRGNTASRAGALEVFSTNGVVVANCLFVDNVSSGTQGGGAIWMGSGGNTQVRNCAVVGNVATVAASGGLNSPSANPVISNSIFWDNEGAGGAQGPNNQIAIPGAANVTYSIVEGGFAGTGNIASAPAFLNPGAGDYRLGLGSPAIDAGDNAGAAGGAVVDLGGEARFVDDPSVADTGSGTAPLIDIGPYEHQGANYTTFCFGNGSGTPCPCSNPGAAESGCANGTFAEGCQLEAVGTPSVSNDTLTLIATRSKPGGPGIFFQGDNRVNGGLGNPFGDGLECAGGAFCSIQVVVADGSGTAISSLSLAERCGVSSGETKRLQWWYRDAQLSPCGSGFNVSNGLELTWAP